MVKTAIIALLAIGGLVLVGCGVSGEKVDSADSVVGTWHRVGGGHEGYCRYSRDGTALCAESLDELANTDNGLPDDFDDDYFQYWFEGSRYLEQDIEGTSSVSSVRNVSVACSETGVYEIYIQSSGNLRYELIEDECQERIAELAGQGIYEGEIEWEPVP